ncbi:hypothetical protein SAMN05443287_10928 [Micromonospora phaseoli]|uniref:Uncharacterized protein n=1 Tax=Micromonospora phaseoli TaxID=1144548 RepID=A0A1H7CAV7_9ACTN|nr:hypothetical protein [Micromonospora phaseoli]PZV97958.1 hypothetical protein CLV64_105226 [Micromonospora phaseoli]GIJ78625.1 hypothetical protein Xph01_30570 [Micromonospora phaseoli]SEJ86778.1 hypothetical protein SAMN05443287_10928 [Micromonospora phaseoli]
MTHLNLRNVIPRCFDRREFEQMDRPAIRHGDHVELACEAVDWVDRDIFPAVVRVVFTDAQGSAWSLVDKAPIFSTDLDSTSALPRPAAVRCVVEEFRAASDAASTPLVLVSTEPDKVAAEDGTSLFLVSLDLLRPSAAR